MSDFGIVNINLLWFTSHLENIKQAVSINDVLSKEKNIKYSVPWGSV